MTNTFIDVFEKSCIYREFINDLTLSRSEQVELKDSLPCSTLLIIVYFSDTNKFYQTKLTSTEWESYSKNFTLQELEMIFKVCFNKISGYNLSIDANDSHINLVFKCREIIKTYEWTITLRERINLEKELMQNYIAELQQTLQNEQKIQLLEKKFNELEEGAYDIFFFRNKELSMIPYISQISQPRKKLDNNVLYQKVVERALDEKSDDANDVNNDDDDVNDANNDCNDVLSDDDEYNLISKNRSIMNSYLPKSWNNKLCGSQKSSGSSSENSTNESEDSEATGSDDDDSKSGDSDDNFEYRSFMKTKIDDLKKLYPDMYKTYYNQHAEKEWNKHLRIKNKNTN